MFQARLRYRAEQRGEDPATSELAKLMEADPEVLQLIRETPALSSDTEQRERISTVVRKLGGTPQDLTDEAMIELLDDEDLERRRRIARRKKGRESGIDDTEEALETVSLEPGDLSTYGVQSGEGLDLYAEVNGTTAAHYVLRSEYQKAEKVVGERVDAAYQAPLREAVYNDGSAQKGADGWTPVYAGNNGKVSPKQFEAEFSDRFNEAMSYYPAEAVETARWSVGDKLWLRLPPKGRGAAGYWNRDGERLPGGRRKVAHSIYTPETDEFQGYFSQVLGEGTDPNRWHEGQKRLATRENTDDNRAVLEGIAEEANEQLRRARENKKRWGRIHYVPVPNRPLLAVKEITVGDESRLAIVEKTQPTAVGQGEKVPVVAFDNFDTAVHELGHKIEDTHPKIQRMSNNFVTERTADLSSDDRGKVMGWKFSLTTDGFYDSYVSWTYAHGSTEIMSMGMEALFGNGRRDRNAGGMRRLGKAAAHDPEPFDDPGHRSLILGSLELLKGKPAED